MGGISPDLCLTGLSEGASVRDYLALLKSNRNFRLLWLAQVISLTGDWFNTIVLSVLISQFTDGSGLAISLFLLARFLPPLLISPLAGVVVDRFNRQQILVYCNVARTGVVLLFLVALTPERLWMIYALTVVQFMFSALFEPGQSAITPMIVPQRDLVRANTLYSVTWSAMLAFGAIIGGIVAAVVGKEVALVIDALTFAVAGWLISRMQVESTAAAREQQRHELAEDGSFAEGLRYLKTRPDTLMMVLVKAGNSIGNVDTLMTVYATQVFIIGAAGEISLSYMYSAFGVGAVLGPFLANRLHDGSSFQMRRFIGIGFVLSLLGWVILGFAGALWMVCAALMVRAIGGSINWTYSAVVIQRTVPERFMGRISSLDYASFQLATVISTLAHGLIVDWVGVDLIDAIALGTGVIALLPVVVWMVWLPRAERRDVVLVAGD